jgi:hypothetical protein
VIKHVYRLLAGDEARHSGCYRAYMKRALDADAAAALRAFCKVGVLMASGGRAGKALHPTNLHVNRTLFPNDTVQSRLPDPGWLQVWLDQQIRFRGEWEERVSRDILRSLSHLFQEPIASLQQLNRYRRRLLEDSAQVIAG